MFPEYKFILVLVILWKGIQPSMEEIKTQQNQKAFILIIKYRELLLKLKNMTKVLEGNSSLSLATLFGH